MIPVTLSGSCALALEWISAVPVPLPLFKSHSTDWSVGTIIFSRPGDVKEGSKVPPRSSVDRIPDPSDGWAAPWLAALSPCTWLGRILYRLVGRVGGRRFLDPNVSWKDDRRATCGARQKGPSSQAAERPTGPDGSTGIVEVAGHPVAERRRQSGGLGDHCSRHDRRTAHSVRLDY